MPEYTVTRVDNTTVTVSASAVQGTPGSSALFTLKSSVIVPALVTPVTVDFLETPIPDGTSVTGTLGGIYGTLTRSGNSYTFTRSIPGLQVTLPVGTQFSIMSDPRTRAVITANASIPTSGSVTLSVSPTDLIPSGGALLGSIRSVLGTLSNSGGIYTFTPSTYPGAPVAVTGNTDIFVAGSQSAVTLGNTSGVMYLNGQQLNFGTEQAVQFTIPIADPYLRNNPSATVPGLAATDSEGRVVLGVLANGGIYAPTLPLNSIVTDGTNYYWSAQDSNGLWQIYKSGNTGTVTQLTLLNDDWNPQIVGSEILFWSNRDGYPGPWRMDTDGSNKHPLFLKKFIARDWNHILLSGGPNAWGINPATTTTQPFSNLKFSGNGSSAVSVTQEPGVTYGGPVTLVEQGSETAGSAIANLLTQLAVAAGQTGFISLMSGTGISTNTTGLAQLKKGSSTFDAGVQMFNAGKSLATTASKTYCIRAVCWMHGGADSLSGSQFYAQNLLDLQDDYETVAKSVTGQVEPVPLIVPQFSAWTLAAFGSATNSLIPYAQRDAAKSRPGRIYIPCPMYHLTYGAGSGTLTVAGMRQLGEHIAIAIKTIIIDGKQWRPVQPNTITRNGANIQIVFDVPVAPLVLDTTLVSNPGNYGFEYSDNSGSTPTIAAVTLLNSTTVNIALSSVPSATAAKRIRYAYTGTAGNEPGPTTGARGNLRDSQNISSRYGFSLFNWCLHFDEACP